VDHPQTLMSMNLTKQFLLWNMGSKRRTMEILTREHGQAKEGSCDAIVDDGCTVAKAKEYKNEVYCYVFVKIF